MGAQGEAVGRCRPPALLSLRPLPWALSTLALKVPNLGEVAPLTAGCQLQIDEAQGRPPPWRRLPLRLRVTPSMSSSASTPDPGTMWAQLRARKGDTLKSCPGGGGGEGIRPLHRALPGESHPVPWPPRSPPVSGAGGPSLALPSTVPPPGLWTQWDVAAP